VRPPSLSLVWANSTGTSYACTCTRCRRPLGHSGSNRLACRGTAWRVPRVGIAASAFRLGGLSELHRRLPPLGHVPGSKTPESDEQAAGISLCAAGKGQRVVTVHECLACRYAAGCTMCQMPAPHIFPIKLEKKTLSNIKNPCEKIPVRKKIPVKSGCLEGCACWVTITSTWHAACRLARLSCGRLAGACERVKAEPAATVDQSLAVSRLAHLATCSSWLGLSRAAFSTLFSPHTERVSCAENSQGD